MSVARLGVELELLPFPPRNVPWPGATPSTTLPRLNMARRFLGPLAGGTFQFMMTLLLLAVYVVVFVPGALLLRFAGKDPLTRKWEPNRPSYWQSRKVRR